MMTKKCYACICASKDKMQEILRLSANAANIGRIRLIADQFIRDFGDVDPDWRPGRAAAKPAAAKPAPAPAPVRQAEPAPAKPRPLPRAGVDPYSSDPNYKPPLF